MSANPVPERGWWAGPDAVNENRLNGPPRARRADAEVAAR
jgi:hypothetical protein